MSRQLTRAAGKRQPARPRRFTGTRDPRDEETSAARRLARPLKQDTAGGGDKVTVTGKAPPARLRTGKALASPAHRAAGPVPARSQQHAQPGMNPGAKARAKVTLIRKNNSKEKSHVTSYKLNCFTMADAQPLAGKTAGITEWDDDELETKVTYPRARIIGIIVLAGPYLVIETAGAVITGARTGERLGTRPPEPGLCLWFTWVCEVADVRDRFQRDDRVALEHTGDPGTRLRPGDEGTVTRYDPGPGQLDVRWDSGSTLAVLLDDGDRVRLITPAPGAGETGKETGR